MPFAALMVFFHKDQGQGFNGMVVDWTTESISASLTSRSKTTMQTQLPYPAYLPMFVNQPLNHLRHGPLAFLLSSSSLRCILAIWMSFVLSSSACLEMMRLFAACSLCSIPRCISSICRVLSPQPLFLLSRDDYILHVMQPMVQLLTVPLLKKNLCQSVKQPHLPI